MNKAILAGLLLVGLTMTSCKIVIGTGGEWVDGESNLDLSGIDRVQASGFNGKVTVQGGAQRGHLRITRKGDTEVRLYREAGTLKVEGVKRSNPCINCAVSLELDLPSGLELDLASSNGPIAVTDNGLASLKLVTSNGPITVVRAKGRVEARTSNGAITINDVEFPANSSNSLETSNGPVIVTGVAAPNGLSITGSTSNSPATVILPGYDVSLDRNTFTAIKAGGAAASLRLHTSNAPISVR